MLTDYHVHLRPDEDGTTAERYFTAANAERYREAAAERGIEELGRGRARPPLRAVARRLGRTPGSATGRSDDLDAYCDFVREETDLQARHRGRLPAGREDRMANLLDGRDWDYVVGSVHFLRDEAVDLHG